LQIQGLGQLIQYLMRQLCILRSPVEKKCDLCYINEC
jgi:hypothetical protein